MQERWFLNQCVKPMSCVSHQIIWSDLKHYMFSASRQREACVRARMCVSDTVVHWHGLCDILQSFAGVNDEWVQTLQLGTHEHVHTQTLQNVHQSEMHTCKHMYHESPRSERVSFPDLKCLFVLWNVSPNSSLNKSQSGSTQFTEISVMPVEYCSTKWERGLGTV